MVNTNPSFPQEELKSFKDISFKLGSNSHLVQAAGGNTSIKSDGRMLIKASGTWLINSLDKDIFVEVDLNSITQKINNAKEDNFVDDIISKNNLHPSSETSFHALIKYKYVLHVHSTATIANAISQSSESDLKKYLDEEFIFIPYCRPGFTLTMEIKKLILPSTNILILENHGLIVAGDVIEDTYKLLLKIHKKLDLIRNENLGLDYLEEITNIDGYNHKNTDKYKLFSTHNEKFISLFPKSFYPDHVIFLGPGIPTFLDEKEANEFIQNLKKKNINLPPYLILKYKGLFENTLAIPAAKEMIDCFLEVLLRIDLSKSLKFLSSLQESELLNWDIEIYRQSIN